VGPRAGLDMEKSKFLSLSVLELRSLGRPARSQSLYLSWSTVVISRNPVSGTYTYDYLPKAAGPVTLATSP
jgi:hypothetical protein